MLREIACYLQPGRWQPQVTLDEVQMKCRFYLVTSSCLYSTVSPVGPWLCPLGPWLVREGQTHWQGHQDPSKSVPIFLRGTEAYSKMVPINPVHRVPIPLSCTVEVDRAQRESRFVKPSSSASASTVGGCLEYDSAEWEPAFLRQARELA